ncbi:HEAT repeat domain-containing protein [Streptomyces sp. NPDC058326]|uniref:HEAT repeat domain-containing protein n=1 Tax=Streptomyces sp. NPDC058326 TaxID=3346447 RepID=UPI0036E726E8
MTPTPPATPARPGSAGPHVPASPEAALALADAALVGGPLPSWREWPAEVLVPPVRVALLRAELVRDPAALLREDREELLYQAVRGTDARAGAHPAALVAALAGTGDAVLEGEALRLARDGLRAGVLGSALVREVLTGLLESAADTVVTGALAGLAEPWASVEPLPAARLTGLLGRATADAALTTAAAHGHGALLRDTAADPELPPRVRRRALALYGGTATRDDVPGILALAGQDPLLLGGPAVDCLRAMHRRGHFVTDTDVPAVLALALADHRIPARTVATVLFTGRREVLRLLAGTAPDDPGWPRRLDLLVALDAQGVAGLPVAAEIARVLPLASAPGPFLRALRDLSAPETEDAVLAALPHAPADALDALEAVGGDRTVHVLAEALGLHAVTPAEPTAPRAGEPVGPAEPTAPRAGEPVGPAEPTAPRTGEPVGLPAPHPGPAPAVPGPACVEGALRGLRHRALELVWLLARDPELRRRLLAGVDAGELPARVVADLGGPDERELALLAARLDPEQPVAALCRLAAYGSPGTLPVLADLLLRIAHDLAAAWEPGGTGTVPDAEPVVPQEVLDALSGLGRRLYARGRIRPVCLLKAPDAEAAGQALAAELALDLLDRPDLTAGEQRILLRVLLDLPHAPHRRIRSRLHRFLRHPDRHVRKHVVALLARDTTGDGVEAVSATLIALTGQDRDPQTVRQTLAALGDAGARWSSDTIARCLGHPVMNVRKTAARALATAGTAQAVPHLLHRLGHDDNPGLRALLLDALRALLGDTLPATITATAARQTDRSVRARLLAALSEGPGPDQDEADLRRLTEHGWDPDTALRLLARHAGAGGPGAERRVVRLRALRPYLADWLELAATSAPARRAVLAVLTTGVCPGPWAPHERAAFTRHVTVLLDGLTEAEAEGRDALIEVLEAVAPHLRPPVSAQVTAAVRALPPRRPGRRSTLPLLRLTGAVVVRADLDRELTATALAPDPEAARVRLLRATFGVETRQGRPPWHAELASAVRDMEALTAYRRRPAAADSRELLAALTDLEADAPPDVRAALVDWMTDLQPLGAPPWTLAETARTARSGPAPRRIQVTDLDQPRSGAQRARLLAMLDSDVQESRTTAARTLLTWPEPDTRAAVLDAYLRGRVDIPDGSGLRAALGFALADATPEALLGDGRRADRVARIAAGLDGRRLEPLLPVLLRLWEHGPKTVRPDASAALRRVPADVLARHLEGRIATGATGLLDLLTGRPLLRTPALTRLDERHPGAGLVLVDGPLRGPEDADRQAAALHALRERAPLPDPRTSSATAPPTAEAMTALLRSAEPRRIRRALARLTEHPADLDGTDLEAALRELLTHRDTGVRLHAHRTSRALLDRDTHLRLTEILLDDAQPDVVRGAIRVLSRARRRSAVPALVALLDHGHVTVRRSAEAALLHAGQASVPALRRAASHARPDRRPAYEALLTRIRQQEQEEENGLGRSLT